MRPHARKKIDGSAVQSHVEIATNTIQQHVASVACATIFHMEDLVEARCEKHSMCQCVFDGHENGITCTNWQDKSPALPVEEILGLDGITLLKGRSAAGCSSSAPTALQDVASAERTPCNREQTGI